MKQTRKNRFPKGWDEKRVKKVLDHYEHQSEDEAAREDEQFLKDPKQTLMEIPRELVPQVRRLLAKHHG